MLNVVFIAIFVSILHRQIPIDATSLALPKIGSSDLFNLRGPNEQVRFSDPNCGYSSCPATDRTKLNVHIVAHSHDDVGWLKTVDQYYYGTKKRFSGAGVQHILDSVIPQLVMDKSKRFIYVEMSFFAKWWYEQDESMKSIVQRLIDEGRLEIINGGWCMNDEATVNYHSVIDQMTLGLKFLNDNLGPCARPKVGWQIDPFGHSNEQASLFAQFGFDGMFFSRIGYQDKFQRTLNKSLDIIWRADQALVGQTGSIFTNIFRDGYDAPDGFCFDVLCLDDNLVDNQKSFEFNINSKGQSFIKYIREYAEAKMTNNVLIPMGGDFQFTAAGQNFKNLDKLIKYVQQKTSDINIFYSTPSCYQNAVYQSISERSLKLPDKLDDFMPYDSSPTVWWSGYFSSRPSVKLIEREIANLLQVARLISLANLLKLPSNKRWVDEVKDHENRCLMPLWEILGDLQHHDAVTGTEKQHVADDYVRRASEAATLCAKFIGELRRAKLNEYLRKSPKYEQLRDSGKRFMLDPVYLEETSLCPLLNISQCDAIESNVDARRYLNLSRNSLPSNLFIKSPEIPIELETKSVLLNVYNPLARPISQHDIRLPCNGRCDLDHVRVIHVATNETMKLIRLPVPGGIVSIPFRDALTNYEVLFYANIAPLGYTSFIVEDNNREEIVEEEVDPSDSIVITDDQSSSSSSRSALRSRRIKRDSKTENFEYFTMSYGARHKRESSLSQPPSASDRVIVKFDLNTGMISGLKRVSDGSVLNITQKFGFYLPAQMGSSPGAYIFRPNTSEPYLFEKPIVYKMFKRKNGALIEIHQKWADWLWQTIRVDAKKNYIEFDYVVGPIPINQPRSGREVITRYITNLSNKGVFLTDSNARQLMVRRRLRSQTPEELGGSFYPVSSTILLKNVDNQIKNSKNSADMVAVLVDRPQAATSLNEGQLELLIHRRLMNDDNFGVNEALDEPGEDGRGLITRGKHRLYLKFQDLPEMQVAGAPAKLKRAKLFKLPDMPALNLAYEKHNYQNKMINKTMIQITTTSNHLVYDQVFNDLKMEAIKQAFKPVLTFDRLRVSSSEFMSMIGNDASSKVKTDLAILNNTLPNNVCLLTLQPWTNSANEVLIRLENLDNPLTLHPHPDYENYQNLLRSYRFSSDYYEMEDQSACDDKARPKVEVDIEYLIKRIRFVSLEELNLGANAKLKDDKRINWTDDWDGPENCDTGAKPNSIKLAPRQIRTFLARFEPLQ